VLEEAGVTGPEMGFGPDATFFLPNRNDASAQFYMESRKLEDRKFICIVPRSRYTPYHRIHVRIIWDREQTDRVIAENLKYAEEDHQKLREVIIRYVRETGNKVVLCPEMEYQTELYESYLYNPLPSDVKDHILMHPYWQPDDAASLYALAAVVVSAECHSPIIALVNGTPAIYVRQPSDTIKGHMYYDLKLDDWIFEIEQTTGTHIADRVMEIVGDLDQSLDKVRLLNERVRGIYEGNMEELMIHIIK
jgi:polysaccharide pyruvyl transferase WcaK-like protein